MNASRTLGRYGTAAALVAVALVLAATAGAGARTPAKAQGQPEFKLGLLLPLTGPLALPGARIRVAVQYAVSEINRRGGVSGRRVTLVTIDDAADPTQDVQGVTRLLNQDRVDFVFGPITSDGMLAILPSVTRARKAVIGVVGSPRLTPSVMRYGFSILLNAGEQATKIVQYANSRGWRRVAVLHDSGEQGKSADAVMREQIQRRGMTLTESQEYNVGATDVTAQLLALRGENPQALLLFPTTGTDTGRVLQGLNQLNWDIPVVGGYGAHYGADVARVAGRPAMSRLVATTYAAFGKCPRSGVPNATKSFINGIRRFNPEAFDSLVPALDLTAAVRDGIWVMKRAVEGARSTRGDRVAAWLERNSQTLGRGLVNPKVTVSRNSHFLFGPSSMVLVRPGIEVSPGVYPRADC
jgi:ABC-type branched-subunit amino acid transport system substrate-binding protein